MAEKDPVCGMDVEPARAAAEEEFEGRTFYFCCEHCHRKFLQEPERYAGEA